MRGCWCLPKPEDALEKESQVDVGPEPRSSVRAVSTNHTLVAAEPSHQPPGNRVVQGALDRRKMHIHLFSVLLHPLKKLGF